MENKRINKCTQRKKNVKKKKNNVFVDTQMPFWCSDKPEKDSVNKRQSIDDSSNGISFPLFVTLNSFHFLNSSSFRDFLLFHLEKIFSFFDWNRQQKRETAWESIEEQWKGERESEIQPNHIKKSKRIETRVCVCVIENETNLCKVSI